MNAGIVCRAESISRKAKVLADMADRGCTGNTIADAGRELLILVKDLADHTDQLGDDAWKKIWLPDGPPF